MRKMSASPNPYSINPELFGSFPDSYIKRTRAMVLESGRKPSPQGLFTSKRKLLEGSMIYFYEELVKLITLIKYYRRLNVR